MASKTTTIVMDDLDGSEGAATHTFALDKQTYSIDLTDENFSKLQAALQPFIDAVPSQPARARRSTSTAASDYDREAFKTWAVENDIKLGRGRPPRTLIDAFLAGTAPAPAKKSTRKSRRS